MAGGVPGTDLRSIPDYEPIPALYDMEAVEATGGEASDINYLEGEEGMEGPEQKGLGPKEHAEMMELINEIGPDIVMMVLEKLAENPQMIEMLATGGMPPGGPDMPPGGPGGAPAGPGGAPMPPGGPVGALSGLEV